MPELPLEVLPIAQASMDNRPEWSSGLRWWRYMRWRGAWGVPRLWACCLEGGLPSWEGLPEALWLFIVQPWPRSLLLRNRSDSLINHTWHIESPGNTSSLTTDSGSCPSRGFFCPASCAFRRVAVYWDLLVYHVTMPRTRGESIRG